MQHEELATIGLIRVVRYNGSHPEGIGGWLKQSSFGGLAATLFIPRGGYCSSHLGSGYVAAHFWIAAAVLNFGTGYKADHCLGVVGWLQAFTFGSWWPVAPALISRAG